MKTPRIFILLFLSSCITYSSFSQTVTTVQDTIWTDEVWSDDTVKVAANIVVMEGAKLTIDPGTQVKFQGYYGIMIFGSLQAIGTPEDSIVFTIQDTTLFFDDDTTSVMSTVN
ncbi:hypothetical protein ACFLTA_09645 [Bacteroidota bacterium]